MLADIHKFLIYHPSPIKRLCQVKCTVLVNEHKLYIFFKNYICYSFVLPVYMRQCWASATHSVTYRPQHHHLEILEIQGKSLYCYLLYYFKNILIWFYLFTINLFIKEVAIIPIVIWHSSLPDNYVCLWHTSTWITIKLETKQTWQLSAMCFSVIFSQYHDL